VRKPIVKIMSLSNRRSVTSRILNTYFRPLPATILLLGRAGFVVGAAGPGIIGQSPLDIDPVLLKIWRIRVDNGPVRWHSGPISLKLGVGISWILVFPVFIFLRSHNPEIFEHPVGIAKSRLSLVKFY